MDDWDGGRRYKSVLGAAGLRDCNIGARCKLVVVMVGGLGVWDDGGRCD